MSSAVKLRVKEIFYSIQGESLSVGLPTVFVRLTGCPLRCQYCDTAYAFSGGEWYSIPDIITKIKNYPSRHITLTGGEPLAQKNALQLLKILCDEDYLISLETSGAIDISNVDPRVIIVMDLKTPASGESQRNLWDNLKHLKKTDQIKFVICNREDYDWAKASIQQYNLNNCCTVLFSPSFKELPLVSLSDWILQDGLDVRLQCQLHKFIWGDVPGK